VLAAVADRREDSFLKLLIYAGLRCIEVRRLRWDAVNWDALPMWWRARRNNAT
jgi:integrase